MDLYEGKTPMRNVESPMVVSAMTSVFFRPARSPKWPKSAPPIGRAKNAIPKVASDARTDVAGSVAGKKSFGKTNTAAVA
jgi:hypothetical protein